MYEGIMQTVTMRINFDNRKTSWSPDKVTCRGVLTDPHNSKGFLSY